MNLKTLIRPLVLAVLLFVSPGLLHAHNGVAHGDHDAHHGGFVMMYRDLHCEVVVKPSGIVQLYLTDAGRADLPAAVISDVAVELERKGMPTEPVAMAISASGDFWEGKSKAVSPMGTTVRAAFVFQGEPVAVNLPATAVMGGGVKAAVAQPATAKPSAVKPPAKAPMPGKPQPAAAPMGGMEHHGH